MTMGGNKLNQEPYRFREDEPSPLERMDPAEAARARQDPDTITVNSPVSVEDRRARVGPTINWNCRGVLTVGPFTAEELTLAAETYGIEREAGEAGVAFRERIVSVMFGGASVRERKVTPNTSGPRTESQGRIFCDQQKRASELASEDRMTENCEKCQSARQPCDAENYQNWISRLPPKIQRMIERHPPSCYHIHAPERIHCQPQMYRANGTLSAKHLEGSCRPAGRIFHVMHPEDLKRCDCGATGHVQVL